MEDGHEWVAGGCVEDGFGVTHAEEDSDEHGEAEDAVEEDTGHHGAGDVDGGIGDFLGHLHVSSAPELLTMEPFENSDMDRCVRSCIPDVNQNLMVL